MKKKILAVIVIAIWLIIISIFMLLAWRIDLEIFFVLWLIGLLVIIELMDNRFSTPLYMKYFKYVVTAGILLFGWIVAWKVLEILHR
jgi:c-di-AMP phosphodiesterase-like protein